MDNDRGEAVKDILIHLAQFHIINSRNQSTFVNRQIPSPRQLDYALTNIPGPHSAVAVDNISIPQEKTFHRPLIATFHAPLNHHNGKHRSKQTEIRTSHDLQALAQLAAITLPETLSKLAIHSPLDVGIYAESLINAIQHTKAEVCKSIEKHFGKGIQYGWSSKLHEKWKTVRRLQHIIKLRKPKNLPVGHFQRRIRAIKRTIHKIRSSNFHNSLKKTHDKIESKDAQASQILNKKIKSLSNTKNIHPKQIRDEFGTLVIDDKVPQVFEFFYFPRSSVMMSFGLVVKDF